MVEIINGIKSIKHRTITDEVISQLTELIVSGSLKPGDRLPSEAELCKGFSVGRTTIRESLKVLSAIGMIERSRRGTFVKTCEKKSTSLDNYHIILKSARMSDLFEVRRALEIENVSLAAERASDEDINTLRAILSEMIATSDNFAEYMVKDAQFHAYLGEASGNEVLSKLTAGLFELLLEAMDEVYSKEPAVTKRTNQFHTNIFKAVEGGLPDVARKAMLQHLDYVYSIITGNIQE